MGNYTKVSSVVLSVTTAIWLSGSAMLIPVAHAQSVADLQAQIQALLSQIQALQAQLLAAQGGGAAPACNFTRDLTVGSRGDDVKCLQQYLNGAGYRVASSGPGSPGNETTYFGSLTRAAVAKWQAANGVSPTAGYFGPRSRAKYSELAVAAPAPTPGPTPAPSVGSKVLTVSLAPDQPPAGLFGENFASRPFTKLQFTASADSDITVKTLVVERTGQGADAAFSGVVHLDEDGVRMGTAKTFGSDHRARLTDGFIVRAGQTRTITLAGDSDSDQDAYQGQLVSLSLVGVESTADQTNAAFPLTGNSMTVNSTLSVGSLRLERGPSDPGSSQTKEVGTKNYTFSAIRMTAGSAEDVLVKSIRWNQSGSAATGDIGNLKVYLDGTPYDVTLSEDGKYYTAKFGSGIKIEKGLNKEVLIKGDINSGSGRTVDFDLYRYADIQATGLTFGYGILPTASETNDSTDDDGDFQSNNPNFDAYQVTIGAGSLGVEKAVEVSAQNIAINLSNQVLGGFVVDVKGEPVSVAAMNFDLSIIDADATGGSVDTNDITNITLVDPNGTVVAGPVDGVAGGNNAIRFTDTVTFPVGRTVYTLKGKLGTDLGNNDTVAASTTPSSDWTTVRGVTTGQTITPTGSTVTMNTMTVKAADLVVGVSSDTNAASTGQNVVAGTNAYGFTKYILDASGSGEDIRLTQMALRLAIGTANTADDMTNCQLFDGSTALNTGTNVVNPSNSDASGDTKTFTLDSGLIIPKGTVKTLTLKCNLTAAASAGQTYGWGITNAADSVVSSGVISGTSLTETINADNGRTITARAAGTLSIALDTSSPALKWVQAGATDQTLAVLRLNALYEDVRLDTLPLQLSSTASNTPSDLSKVTIWNGSTKVGEAVFTSDFATATLSGAVVPKDGQMILTVKGDIADIYINGPARPGHLIAVDYDADSSSDETILGAIGIGTSSGTIIASGGSDTSSNGARIAKAVPTVTKMSLSSNTFGQSTSGKPLYRFKISAPSGTNGVSLYKFTFNIATSSKDVNELPGAGLVDPDFSNDFGVTNLVVKCYSDEFITPSCGNTSGTLNQFDLAIADGTHVDFDDGVTSADPDVDVSVLFNPKATSGSTPESIVIPAGATYYFELLGDINNATTTASIAVKLQGDAAYMGGGDNVPISDDWTSEAYSFAKPASVIDSLDDEDDFIWSGNSTNTSQSISDIDWFNGFLVPGLSNTDTGVAEILSKS